MAKQKSALHRPLTTFGAKSQLHSFCRSTSELHHKIGCKNRLEGMLLRVVIRLHHPTIHPYIQKRQDSPPDT